MQPKCFHVCKFRKVSQYVNGKSINKHVWCTFKIALGNQHGYRISNGYNGKVFSISVSHVVKSNFISDNGGYQIVYSNGPENHNFSFCTNVMFVVKLGHCPILTVLNKVVWIVPMNTDEELKCILLSCERMC